MTNPNTEPTTALVPIERPRPMMLRPIAAPKDVLVAQEETRKLIEQALTRGRDYGRSPGTDKDALFKAGAERVVLAFGCFARFRIIEQEVDHDRVVTYTKKGKESTSLGLYRYVVECQIVNRADGEIVGSFIASCSSMESKYISRPRDTENTIVKMAEKRALVGAALTTYGLSDQFTQDVEEAGKEDGASTDDAADADHASQPANAAPAKPEWKLRGVLIDEKKPDGSGYKVGRSALKEAVEWAGEKLADQTDPAEIERLKGFQQACKDEITRREQEDGAALAAMAADDKPKDDTARNEAAAQAAGL